MHSLWPQWIRSGEKLIQMFPLRPDSKGRSSRAYSPLILSGKSTLSRFDTEHAHVAILEARDAAVKYSVRARNHVGSEDRIAGITLNDLRHAIYASSESGWSPNSGSLSEVERMLSDKCDAEFCVID